MPEVIRTQVLDEYGPLSAKVRILRPQNISSIPRTVGYRSQQVLKLCVAEQGLHRALRDPRRKEPLRCTGRAWTLCSSRTAERGSARIATWPTGCGHGSSTCFGTWTSTRPHTFRNSPRCPAVRVRHSSGDIADRRHRTKEQAKLSSGIVVNALTEFFLYVGRIIANSGSLETAMNSAGLAAVHRG